MSDREWWSARGPLLAKVFDPDAYPVATRVGAAAGLAHDAAYDPDHAYRFGLQRVLDGLAALIGSTNFNRRSMDHDEEVMLAVLDPEFTAGLDRDFDADLERSARIDGTRWHRRAMWQRLREAAVRPVRRFL